MKLEQIPINVTGPENWMLEAVLVEIAEMLHELAEDSSPGTIDLRSLPMSDHDRGRLEERLGRGEVAASLDVAGLTEIWETSYTGVWWVRHRGRDGDITNEEIVVTQMPDFLISPIEDVNLAAERLSKEMNLVGERKLEEA